MESPKRFFKIQPIKIKETREVTDLKASWLKCLKKPVLVEGRPIQIGDFVIRDPENKKDCWPVSLNYITNNYKRVKIPK